MGRRPRRLPLPSVAAPMPPSVASCPCVAAIGVPRLASRTLSRSSSPAGASSVRIHLIPAARGTGIVASPTSKKVLQMAGISDCYTASQGHTKTRGNFAKAAFDALGRSYGFLTPDLWQETKFLKAPYQEHTDYLAKTHHVKRVTSSLMAPQPGS